jgi:hypothetical protein
MGRRYCGLLRYLARVRAWLGYGPDELGPPDKVVGGGSEREHRRRGRGRGEGLAKPGGPFGPAEDFLNPLSHPATDRIAGVAGRRASIADRRLVVFWATWGVTLWARRVGDKPGHIVSLVGAEREPVIAGTGHHHHLARALARCRAHCHVTRVSTTKACRFSIRTWPR